MRAAATPLNTRISNQIKPCTITLILPHDHCCLALDRVLKELTRAKIQQRPVVVNSAERAGPSVLHLLPTDSGGGMNTKFSHFK